MLLDAPPPVASASPPPAPARRRPDLAALWPAGFHPARAYSIVLLISTFVVSTWFRAGTFIATGDMGPFLRQGWAPGALWSWNYQITGAGSATNTMARAPEFLLWSQINNQVPNVLTLSANWAWYLPQYLPFTADLDRPFIIWMRYLLPVLMFAAPLLAMPRRRRVAMTLLGLSGLSVVLAKGLIPPLSGLNLFLYTHVPGFWLFREPMSKLGQLLVLSNAVLLAIAVEGAIWRFKGRKAKPLRWPAWLPHPSTFLLICTALSVVAVLAWPYPIATGGVIPDNRPQQPSAHVRVPQYWRDLAATINADPSPGKVLVLPLDDYYQMPTRWGFFGVDSIANLLITRGVVAPKPDGYFGDVPGYAADVRAVETALLSGDLTAVPRLLDASGIDKVLVRHDLVRGMPRRTFADPDILAKEIAAVPGMTQAVSGEVDLWKAPATAGETVRAYQDTITVGARPDAAAAVIGSVGNGAAAMALKSSTKSPPYPTVDSSPQVTLDSVQWPVPAVESGDPSTTMRLLPGSYVVAQRARAAAVLTPSLEGRELVFRDSTRVRINGEVVSRRPALRVTVPRNTVALRAGSRTVSLDGWGRDELPGDAASRAAVPVGSATPLTVYAPSQQPADPAPPSEVYDCNNYEPRPAAELGLSKTGTDTIRLQAQDHAACTRIVVRDAAPGRTYRVRLQYRTVAGKRPQICLWQVRTDGCTLAPRPTINRGWHSWEQIITVEPDAESLVLVLHADVGQRLLGRTVTDYRDISIEALDPVKQTEIFPPEVPQREVIVTGGDTTLSVTGGQSGSVLSDFEPLQNCFRYDDQTDQQAGLTAETTGDQHNPSIVLGAREHMACLSATVPDMGQSSLYQLSLEARKVNNIRDPKFCIFLRGLDTCQRLPAPGRYTDQWTPYQTLLSPNPGAVETRLYLYALRDKEAKKPSYVEYRGMSLLPVASPSTVVLVRQPPGGPDVMSARSLPVESTKVSPVQTTVQVAAGAQVVALTETSAPGWSLTGFGRAYPAQGWMASWRVDGQPVDGSARYLPAGLSRKALYVLPVAVLLAFAALYVGRRWRRRRQA